MHVVLKEERMAKEKLSQMAKFMIILHFQALELKIYMYLMDQYSTILPII